MTYHDLCKATDHYSDQTKQISVWKHKTTASYGSAIITVDTLIYDWLQLFHMRIRPFAAKATDLDTDDAVSTEHAVESGVNP